MRSKTLGNRSSEPMSFTLAEANATLPLVGAIVSDLAELSRSVIERAERLSILMQDGDRDAGDPYGDELAQSEREVERDSQQLREYIEELRALGVEPVSGPEGLVDFPATINGRKVYLCWKLGEPQILFWRELNAGYKQRQPLSPETFAGFGIEDGEAPPASDVRLN